MKTYKVPVIAVPHQTEPEIHTQVIQAMLSNGKMVSWEFCFDCRVTVEESHNSVGPAVIRATKVEVFERYPIERLKRNDDNELLAPEEWVEASFLLSHAAFEYAKGIFRR